MEHHHLGPEAGPPAHRQDPRLYQIASLGILLAYGLCRLHFDLSIWQAAVTIGTALLTQYAATRLFNLPFFDPKSALVSSLSLCLLLRTNNLTIAALAAFIAIASKFLFRWRNTHLFNPTNLALAVVVAGGLGWISPGQWGQAAWFAFLIACLGSLVVTRAARADVTLAFLAFYVGLLFIRAGWLGDPFTIPLHQVESGALLIFAFFMISDPKTTPDHASAASSSHASSRWRRCMCSSGCSARTGPCGDSSSARRSCLFSTTSFPAHVIAGPVRSIVLVVRIPQCPAISSLLRHYSRRCLCDVPSFLHC